MKVLIAVCNFCRWTPIQSTDGKVNAWICVDCDRTIYTERKQGDEK